MSRGTATDLPVTSTIVEHLPSIYREHDFLERFTGGLDTVLAPATTTLDSLHGYVDPRLAPGDFVSWLAGWVGLPLDEDWSLERRRSLVGAAVESYGRAGTAHGLRDEIARFTNGAVEVYEPGDTHTAATPRHASHEVGADRIGSPASFTVRVVIDVDDERTVNWPSLQAAVRAAVPAHLAVEIELREHDTEPVPPDEGNDR